MQVTTGVLNGEPGILIFIPATQVAEEAEHQHDVVVTNPVELSEGVVRELTRDYFDHDINEYTTILGEALSDALSNALDDNCRGFEPIVHVNLRPLALPCRGPEAGGPQDRGD